MLEMVFNWLRPKPPRTYGPTHEPIEPVLIKPRPRPEPEVRDRLEPQVKKAPRISLSLLGAASVPPTRTTFEPPPLPRPLPGVAPQSATLAQDRDISSVYDYSMANGLVTEGLTFLGYPYLAELAQRPEYRHIVGTIAREATRKWVSVHSTEESSDRVDLLVKAMQKFRVRELFQQIVEVDGFFGRAQLFIDTGYPLGDPELEKLLVVSPAKIGINGLKRLAVVEPMWTYPASYDARDPLSRSFYNPETWFVQGKRVHGSRLLTFVGNPVPDFLKPLYMFGGLSRTQMAKPYVDNWLQVRTDVSDLIGSFSISGIKTDMDAALSGDSGERLLARIDLFNKIKSNRGTMALNRDTEDWFNIATPLGTLDKLQAQAQEQMASVSGIPLVKLLGITPSGLNASSEGEIRVFYDTLQAFQEDFFRPHLKRVLDIIQLSEFGNVDDGITFRFIPLWDMDENQRATIRQTNASAAEGMIQAGVISAAEERERLAREDDGLYNNIDLSVVPEIPGAEPPDGGPDGGDGDGPPDDSGDGPGGGESPPGDYEGEDALIPHRERRRLGQDEGFEEQDHPRDDAGKFATGMSKKEIAHATSQLDLTPYNSKGEKADKGRFVQSPLPQLPGPRPSGEERGQYAWAREGWSKFQDVDPSRLYADQPTVMLSKLKSYLAKPDQAPDESMHKVPHPIVIKHPDGKMAVYDGNHRASAAKLRGAPIHAEVVDIGQARQDWDKVRQHPAFSSVAAHPNHLMNVAGHLKRNPEMGIKAAIREAVGGHRDKEDLDNVDAAPADAAQRDDHLAQLSEKFKYHHPLVHAYIQATRHGDDTNPLHNSKQAGDSALPGPDFYAQDAAHPFTKAEWDEAKVKRNADGKFATSGGSKLTGISSIVKAALHPDSAKSEQTKKYLQSHHAKIDAALSSSDPLTKLKAHKDKLPVNNYNNKMHYYLDHLIKEHEATKPEEHHEAPESEPATPAAIHASPATKKSLTKAQNAVADLPSHQFTAAWSHLEDLTPDSSYIDNPHTTAQLAVNEYLANLKADNGKDDIYPPEKGEAPAQETHQVEGNKGLKWGMSNYKSLAHAGVGHEEALEQLLPQQQKALAGYTQEQIMGSSTNMQGVTTIPGKAPITEVPAPKPLSDKTKAIKQSLLDNMDKVLEKNKPSLTGALQQFDLAITAAQNGDVTMLMVQQPIPNPTGMAQKAANDYLEQAKVDLGISAPPAAPTSVVELTPTQTKVAAAINAIPHKKSHQVHHLEDAHGNEVAAVLKTDTKTIPAGFYGKVNAAMAGDHAHAGNAGNADDSKLTPVMQEYHNHIVKTLEDKHTSAVDSYQDGQYRAINHYLNTGKVKSGYYDQETLDRTISNLSEAISRCPIPADIPVYRGLGCGLKALTGFTQDDLAAAIGRCFIHKNFASVSRSKYNATNFSGGRTLMKLTLPAGSKGMVVGQQDWEKEIVMDKNAIFRIDKIEANAEGHHHVVHCTYLGHKYDE